MRALTMILATLLISLGVSKFIPIPDYNISDIEGTWFVQSIYDTTGNTWDSVHCFQLSFLPLNNSTVNMTMFGYDTHHNASTPSIEVLYPDSENAGILYQDPDHNVSPLLIVDNSTLIPYWNGYNSPTLIIAINYTETMDDPQYILMGMSIRYDTQFDIRPFLVGQNLPSLNYTDGFRNFWYINTACDVDYDWHPRQIFNSAALLGEWNLVAVYEPFGRKDLVPWYLQGPLFNWEEATCAKVTFEKVEDYNSYTMTLSLNSLLYQNSFERTWQIGFDPSLNAALMGFDMVGTGSTLLYTGYSDLDGNMILTAGTTTSFFLSSKTNTFTTAQKGIFDLYLLTSKFDSDLDYIYPIAPC